MKLYSQCIGKEIRESSTGKVLSTISDLIFDTDRAILKAVITREDKVLYFSDVSEWKIRVYIKDEIFFQNINSCKDISNILEKKTAIIGARVENDDGVFLGYSEDFSFNEKTGSLIQIVVRSYFLNIIPTKKLLISATDILEITEERILVKSTKVKNAVPDI
jgi:uncharacterized protein YrrD